jgi:hypothetical protein
VPYLISLKKHFRPLKGSNLYWNALFSWGCVGLRMIWWLITKFDLKAATAQAYLRVRRMFHRFLGRREKGSGV